MFRNDYVVMTWSQLWPNADCTDVAIGMSPFSFILFDKYEIDNERHDDGERRTLLLTLDE